MKIKYSQIVALGLTMCLLYACSPPAYDVNVVEKIGISGDSISVLVSRDCSYCDNTDDYYYFFSNDFGRTWKEITNPESDIIQALKLDAGNPPSICLSTDGQMCYRITDQKQVEISNNGGVTWQVDWQIPVGRELYMQRRTPYALDTIPFDIKIIETNTGNFVIVAMGNQGVLVKAPDGDWDRYAVGTATPTPYYASSFSEANEILYFEQIGFVLIAICVFLFVSICAWVLVYINSIAAMRKKILGACSPVGVSVVVFLLYYLILLISPFSISKLIEGFQIIVIPLPFLGFIVSWVWIIIISFRKQFSLLALTVSIGTSLLSYFCLLFMFQLWALGTVSVYETATVASWIFGISILFVGIIVESRIVPLAMKQPNGDL